MPISRSKFPYSPHPSSSPFVAPLWAELDRVLAPSRRPPEVAPPRPRPSLATDWKARLRDDLTLRGYRERTKEAYFDAAVQLVEHSGRSPEELTDEDLRAHFLYLREERRLAPSTLYVLLHALRFFCRHTLERDFRLFELLRVDRPVRLPVVLSRREVTPLLAAVGRPVHRMALTTIYALGLRLGEALSLETRDIDADRLRVTVRDGKGAKDRMVPLPYPLLVRLRRYWREERPRSSLPYLFVAGAERPRPLHDTSLQKAFTAARTKVGLLKRATIHTLRHSYATHLLEAGVTLRTLQMLLGHKHLRTTEIYVHVTQAAVERVQETIDLLMEDVCEAPPLGPLL